MIMQPPEGLRPHLRDAINDLKRKVQVNQSVPQHPTITEVVTTSARYEIAIAKWAATLTPAQRQRRYAMDEIIKLSGAQGCDGKQASVQVMGVALLARGFVQGRDWTVAGRNCRFWKLRGES